MGFLYLTLVVLAITAVALLAKMAARRQVTALDLSAWLFIWGAALGAVVLGGQGLVKGAANVWLFASVAGVGGAFAVLAFNVAVREGHFGFSNAIYRSSFLIPIVYAVLFMGATLRWTTVLGIALILCALFLMSWSAEAGGNRKSLRWFVLIFTAFLLSGAPRVGQNLTSARGGDFFLYLFLSYAVGAGIFLLAMASRRTPGSPAAIRWGAGAALASYLGVFCTLSALKTLKPQVVFPISLSGPIILGMLLSLFLFREKIRFTGWLGVVLGVCGIIILSVWK